MSDGEPAEGPAIGPIGKERWVVPGGFVPTDSTGPEPEMVGHDVLCVLNAGGELASVEVRLQYADDVTPEENVAGPYLLTVAPRRVRHVRVNDLIDPYAPPLGEAYAAVVEASHPVVVQFSRLDSRKAENATMSTVAYGEE